MSERRRTVDIFYSYSHEDERMRDRLEKQLSMLKRESLVGGWHDRKIGAGKDWRGQIDEHLNSADIVLLLVSAGFLASDYCYDVEMKQAMQRHADGKARVIPIILRPCDWKGAPFGKLNALPKDGRPVTTWPNREEAYFKIVMGIRGVVEDLTSALAVPVFSASNPATVEKVYKLRTKPDTSLTEADRDLLVADAKVRAYQHVPNPSLRKKICHAAKRMLKTNKGGPLVKKQLEALDRRFLAGRTRKPDAEIPRWILRAERLHPQGRILR